jgi:hypothetical protein
MKELLLNRKVERKVATARLPKLLDVNKVSLLLPSSAQVQATRCASMLT